MGVNAGSCKWRWLRRTIIHHHSSPGSRVRRRYKGNDITDIEIKADAAANARSISSFQYSLVMKKGSAEIDMRQRCSAGQKVS